MSTKAHTGPYSEPDESRPNTFDFSEFVLILSFHLRLGFPCGLCFQRISAYFT
jgi:hypothetical protein